MEFYNPDSTLFPINDLTAKDVKTALAIVLEQTDYEWGYGDSVDRERVRDVLLDQMGFTQKESRNPSLTPRIQKHIDSLTTEEAKQMLKELQTEISKGILDKETYQAETEYLMSKTATYFDGYTYRVTIESSAADNNLTYSEITNMLSSADIRYQEVRRYNIEPDRVLLDILINKEDVDIIKELDKQGKEYNISFTYNDNVSEGIQPKIITTPEKDVVEKV